MDISARAGSDLFLGVFLALFQIRGLIGPVGILPAGEYLQAVASSVGHSRYWYAPTLLWFSASSTMLMGLCWARADRVGAFDAEHLAAGDAGGLPGMFPFVRERGSGIFRLSIGWNAAGGGIYFVVSCSGGMAAGIRRGASADASERAAVAMGMVPDLL